MKSPREADEKGVRKGGRRLRDRLARSATESVLGRAREIALVASQLSDDGAVVTFIHGTGGIGKSSLVAALEPALAGAGARVARLDGREIEPTPRGLLAALANALGVEEIEDVEAAGAVVDAAGEKVVVIVDEYDRLQLLDAWLRQTLLPALPDRTRWVFAGRFAPRTAWLTTPGWADAVVSLRLGPLDDDASRALLSRRGVAPADMSAILTLARGSPLALELAARRVSTEGLDALAENAVLDALAQRCVADLAAPLRDAVDAMAVVRRATRPLLEAMLGRPCDDGFLVELGGLPFVDRMEDGFVLHDAVGRAVASRLRALDPARHRDLTGAAWRLLEGMLAGAEPTGPDAWRLTADLLFVVQHPEIREAFFPERESVFTVDTATPEDRDAVLAIATRHEPPASAELLARWWDQGRRFFDLARDGAGTVRGFAILAGSNEIPGPLIAVDPLVRAWLADLETGPGASRGALFARRVLSSEDGEGNSEARGALWLAAKRAYIERPSQWALYVGTRRAGAVLPFLQRLGFRDAGIEHAGDGTLRLEFGASGLWSWLRALVHEARTSAPSTTGWRLDEPSRGIVVDGRPIALSPLEYGVLVLLVDARGAVVTRDELLDRVWKQRHTGSNVVDALVRLLRKKLGAYASALETVKGHGYRVTGSSPPVA
jgi:hypothetical protein